VNTYMAEVISKANSLLEANDRLAADKFFKTPLRLSLFFHPVTFLNAMRQQTSRKLDRPIDTLRLVSSWTSNYSSPFKVHVQGVVIQGCKFDGIRLTEAESSDPIFTTIPKFELGWIPEEEVKTEKTVGIPFYINRDRETRIADLLAPAGSINPMVWVLAGAALFLE